MLNVHDIFVCKPGQASKLAKMFKEAMTGRKELVNVMTDLTGQFNRVIIVTQYDDLVAYQNNWDQYKNPTPEMKASMTKLEGYQEMYLSGSREIYQIT